MKRIFTSFLLTLVAIAVVLLLAFTSVLVYWRFRPNTAQVDPRLDLISSELINDGKHNAFPDAVKWQDMYYLVYRSAPNHNDHDSQLIVAASPDTTTWTTIATLTHDEDVRDPKLFVVGDKLTLYALKNVASIANPYTTIAAVSSDGRTWSEWKNVDPENWVYWRPKTPDDGKTWYATASEMGFHNTALFGSADGLHWGKISTILDSEENNEVAISFISDGRLMSVARAAGPRPDIFRGSEGASTMIGVSDAYLQDWSFQRSYVTRLDGAALFSVEDRLFGVGRYEPQREGLLTSAGSAFNRKRTALFLVTPSELIYLSELPSAGDTSYPSVLQVDEHIYIFYYTSPPDRDYPWILGLYLPTSIYLAKIPVDRLNSLADTLTP